MKDQVTSIEQSKRLIEMGVPAEKASMIYQSHFTQGVPKLYAQPYQRNGYPPKEKIREDVVPAFTVADLLAVLPKKIMTNGGKVHILHIEACSSTSPCWCLYWGDEATQVGWQERISFLHLLEDAIEWLCLNGYKLNL
jgi:hypothetical protein